MRCELRANHQTAVEDIPLICLRQAAARRPSSNPTTRSAIMASRQNPLFSRSLPMKPLCVLLVGVVVGWAASDIDWSREAVGEEQGTSQNLDALVPAPSTSVYGQTGNIPATPPQLRGHATGSPLIGRFQVSAYGSPNGHGCYVVDTTTGQTWHVANGQPPQFVSPTPINSAPSTQNPVSSDAWNGPTPVGPPTLQNRD